MKKDPNLVSRIDQELKNAHVSHWGRRSMEAKYLPQIIHSDEHIHAAVFGYCPSGMAMLIATDKRIMFLDCKPFFNNMEEVTYRAVSGVRVTDQPLFSSVMLETRIGNYPMKITNLISAHKFEEYIESNWLEPKKSGPKLFGRESRSKKLLQPAALDPKAKSFLSGHNLAVLSTVGEDQVRGSAVHYLFEVDERIYVLSKSSSNKAQNITDNNEVFLTIYDEDTSETMKIDGIAEIDQDAARRQYIFDKSLKSSYGKTREHFLRLEDFSVLKITPVEVEFS